jgi:hypothetical protein
MAECHRDLDPTIRADARKFIHEIRARAFGRLELIQTASKSSESICVQL